MILGGELIAGNGVVTYADTPKPGCYWTEFWSNSPPEHLARYSFITGQQHYSLHISVYSIKDFACIH